MRTRHFQTLIFGSSWRSFRLAALFPLACAGLTACGESAVNDGGSGGAASGGDASVGGGSTGGTSSGGTAAGGNGTGGAPSGGASTGGAASGGSAATGGSGPLGTGGTSADGGTSAGGSNTGGDSSGGSSTGGTDGGVFALASPSWDDVDNDDCTADTPDPCPDYPRENTNFGDNVSPEMSWGPGPEGTQSYAIVLHDLSNGNAHWAIFDIPATTTSLPAELPQGDLSTAVAPGTKQAGFSALGNAYFGSGACGNVYEHRLYALDAATVEGSPMNAAAVRTALDGSSAVLAETFIRLQSRDCP